MTPRFYPLAQVRRSAGRLLAGAALLLGWAVLAPASYAYGDDDVVIPIGSDGAQVDSGTQGVCIGCSVTDAEHVIADDLMLYATASIPVGLAGSAFVRVDFGAVQPPGRDAGFVLRSLAGIADLALLGSVQLTTYLGGAVQETVTDSALYTLVLLGGDRRAVSFTTSQPFDAVRIDLGAVVGLLNQTAVYHAFASVGGFPVSSEAGAVAGEAGIELFPHPLTDRGTLALSLPHGGDVRVVALYDVLGREVRRFEPLPGGEQALTLDVAGLPAGAYVLVVRSEAPGGAVTRMTRRVTVVGR